VVDVGHLHLVLSQSPRLVETDSFEPAALDGLLGLGTRNVAFSEPHQTETIGEVEQNRIRSREAVGDKIAKPEYFHDPVDFKLVHSRQSNQKDQYADHQHLYLKYD
jgi:hypothetical protein